DWVPKLPAIEFAINIASSELTQCSPCETNTGCQLRAMIWDDPLETKYPGVCVFLQRMKQGIMKAHNSIINA
ncbi:hypothetical protein BDR04DRAFT_1035502, partial [Suillus decipiens]